MKEYRIRDGTSKADTNIGKNGNIPWKIKGEQKQFRELTTGNVVIMGRKLSLIHISYRFEQKTRTAKSE